MGLLEETLRDTFAHRAAAPPVREGLADRAIVGARRVRRRRGMVASAAAALAVALIAFGGLTVATRPGARVPTGGPAATGPSAAASSAPVGRLPLDLLVDGTIHLADGGTFALPPLGTMSITKVWRVATGYLVATYEYSSTPAPASLLYVPASGEPRTLATGASVMVAAGTTERPGVQVAWRDDAGVHLGVFAEGQVSNVVSTRLPGTDVAARLNPQTVVGAALVLAGSQTRGDGLDTWDEWLPSHGGYVPSTDAVPYSSMLAATADGEHIIGGYGGKPGCLGEFDPDGFAMVNHLCPTLFDNFGYLDPSPDGRWWLVVEPSAGARLYDTQTVWNGGGPVRTWSVEGGDGAWVDGNRVMLLTAGGAVVLNAADGSTEQVVLPAGNLKPSIVVDLR